MNKDEASGVGVGVGNSTERNAIRAREQMSGMEQSSDD